MNILVLLKQTFDTEEKITIEQGKISEDSVKFVINPYDEFALEEAMKIKENHGGEVTVVSIGPSRVESAMRTALAIGADRAVIINDEVVFGDEYTTSKVLAAFAKRNSYDIILAGYMAVDNGSGQVGPRAAEELDIPHIAAITKLSIEDGSVKAEKDMEGDTVTIEAAMPVLLTAQQGLNEPRYPTLPGIMKAKKKPLEYLTAVDLGLNLDEIKAKSIVDAQYLPPKKEAGRILQGELKEQVQELFKELRFEAKVV